MTTLQDYATQTRDHDLALNALVQRIAWPKRDSGGKKGICHKRYSDTGSIIDHCQALDNQIKFMDNALYFLEEVVPDRGGLDDDSLRRCHAAIQLGWQLRDRLDLCYRD